MKTVLQSQPTFVTSLSSTMNNLAEKFEKLISQRLKTVNLEYTMVVSYLSKEENTFMDVGEPSRHHLVVTLYPH